MSELHISTEAQHEPWQYEIRLKGHLEARWADCFEGLSITGDANGETLLRGMVVDQAALHGLLRKVRDLGLPLIAVIQMSPDQTHAADSKTTINCKPSQKEINQ